MSIHYCINCANYIAPITSKLDGFRHPAYCEVYHTEPDLVTGARYLRTCEVIRNEVFAGSTYCFKFKKNEDSTIK